MDPFELVIKNMQRLGFFKFLFPYMLTAAIFYGLLRKSQIFGPPEKNITVNGVVALVAAFMVWSYPVIAGVDIEQQLASFFMQGMSATLVIMVGLLITGMFAPPNLPEHLSKVFKKGMWGGVILLGLLVGGGILVSSGLLNIFFPASVIETIPSDIILTVGVVLLLVITVVVIVFAVSREEVKKEEK